MGHLLEAVKQGRATEVLLATLETEATRKQSILGELQDMENRTSIASLEARRLTWEFKARAADTQRLLGRHAAEATLKRA